MRKLSITTFFLFSIVSFSLLIAKEEASIVHVERRPIQHANYSHGTTNPGYHPAIRAETRHDINRAADANALNNAGNLNGVSGAAIPIYPNDLPAGAAPNSQSNSGNSINVYSSPQGTTSTPQH